MVQEKKKQAKKPSSGKIIIFKIGFIFLKNMIDVKYLIALVFKISG